MSRARKRPSGDPRTAGNPARRALAARLREATYDRVTPPGHAYGTPEAFVLRHGQWHTPAVRYGMPFGHCYGSAINVAVVYGWTYVEGWALPPAYEASWASGPLPPRWWEPEPHAWAVDDQGRAVELVWPDYGRAYLGVPFAVGRADEATWDGDACVLHDAERGWPVLAERWEGESWDRPWSDRLAAMAKLLPRRPSALVSCGLPSPPPQPPMPEAELDALAARLEGMMAADMAAGSPPDNR